MYNIVKGNILKVNNDKKTVQVQIFGQPFNVQLHQMIGSAFIPLIKESSLCYVFKINNSLSNAFCIPFDVLEQQKNLPFGQDGDFVQGNTYSGCNITYKVDGSIAQETKANYIHNVNGNSTQTIMGNNEITASQHGIQNNTTSLKQIQTEIASYFTQLTTVLQSVKVLNPITGLHDLPIDPEVIIALTNINLQITSSLIVKINSLLK